MLHISKERCVKCGACIADCPIGILKMDAVSSIPVFVDGGEEVCINCGHCVAVCPRGAFSLDSMPVK